MHWQEKSWEWNRVQNYHPRSRICDSFGDFRIIAISLRNLFVLSRNNESGLSNVKIKRSKLRANRDQINSEVIITVERERDVTGKALHNSRSSRENLLTPFWFIYCGTSSEVIHIALFCWSCSYNYFVHRAVFQFTSKQEYQMYFGFRSSGPGGYLGQLSSCSLSLSKHILTPITKLNISNHWFCQWRFRRKMQLMIYLLVCRRNVFHY